MLTSVTIKCDWHGCEATLTFAPRLPWPDPSCGWKYESGGWYSLHLCPKHKRHDWHRVREQIPRLEAPSTTSSGS